MSPAYRYYNGSVDKAIVVIIKLVHIGNIYNPAYNLY